MFSGVSESHECVKMNFGINLFNILITEHAALNVKISWIVSIFLVTAPLSRWCICDLPAQ
jgi:hypothetical protein